MNKSSFLNYYKTILEKVSFDQKLLVKEYWKAKQLLENSEAKDLDYWLQSKGLARKLIHTSLDQNQDRISNFE
ncbi:hypothetical protein SYJ56_09575 [Algoriphagus sp. D3-2-R+10]|uniref:hypothetical protein n=1 Tax=Algoriphagus aurantiacus TaxID=3103948 RepID=UPI002B3BC867|nr:hypothetical protein [Algoriphagus sp. D3-2-R+10]MEB2775559.1 hypothetical protein [Algoriphagus sp. D3-2-R+10]